jgi:hypothetical protein
VIIQYAQVWKKLEMLKYHADPRTEGTQVALASMNCNAIDLNFTAADTFQAIDGFDERRFT